MAEINNREVKKSQLRRQIVRAEENFDVPGEEPAFAWSKRLIFFGIGGILCAIVVVYLLLRFYKYTGYTVVSERPLAEGSFIGYTPFADNFLKYSRDGVVYLRDSGEEIWIESYEMKMPAVRVNGKFAVVADIGGNRLEIFSAEGKISRASTHMPISKVSIAANGLVAVILEDTKASYINFYRQDGSILDISIKSVLSGDGYPMDLALSPEGTGLMVALQYIQEGQLKGRTVFYDFSEIGKNEPNRLVGGFDQPFSDSLMARVDYLDSIYSFAVADTGLYFFSSRNLASPELLREVPAEGEIMAVDTAEGMVGMVLRGTASQEPYEFRIYMADGDLILREEFGFDFRYFDLSKDYIYLYSDHGCRIYNMTGNLKFEGEIDFSPSLVTKGAFFNEFIFFTPSVVKVIKLQ